MALTVGSRLGHYEVTALIGVEPSPRPVCPCRESRPVPIHAPEAVALPR